MGDYLIESRVCTHEIDHIIMILSIEVSALSRVCYAECKRKDVGNTPLDFSTLTWVLTGCPCRTLKYPQLLEPTAKDVKGNGPSPRRQAHPVPVCILPLASPPSMCSSP